METFQKINSGIRDMRNGDWYWISRSILHIHGRRLMPSGIAVYNALASFADPKTQACFPAQGIIAELIGISRKTVGRKIKLLKELGLIKVERKKGSCLYCLLKPKLDGTNKIQGWDKRDPSNGTPGSINNNHLIKNINNIVNEDKKFLDFRTSKKLRPESREELLALDLAQALDDLKSLPFYLNCAKRYPESLLRRVLGEVKEIPLEKIKKGRAVLFNYLIRKHAQGASENPGD